MFAKYWSIVGLGLMGLSLGPVASAQSQWEAGVAVNFQGSQDISFEGDSRVSTDDDWGLTLLFSYRFSKQLSLDFALDWSQVDYDATIQSGDIPGLSFDVKGDYEEFTPRVGVSYNFMPGDITPYVSGGIGWSFIDTNIPDGPPQTGCWWDPWWGEVCTTWQNTRSTDAFMYQLGLGVRWDFQNLYAFRLGYEKHWYDFDKADSAPDFDWFMLSFSYRF
jgi:opacity protein-like surface antigen